MTKELKICSRCGKEHVSELKTCPKCLEYGRKWYDENKDRISQVSREYHLRNRDKINAKSREYYLKNKETKLVKARERYRTDEEFRKRLAIYAKTPKVRAAVYAQARKRYANDAEHRKYKSEWQKKNDAARKLRVFTHYSKGEEPQCECCGEQELVFLSIDHINGRDNKIKKVTGVRFYRTLEQDGFPEGYRVLCHNCNQAFGILGYCPHQKEG